VRFCGEPRRSVGSGERMRTNDFVRLAGVLEVLACLACSSDDSTTERSPSTNGGADAAAADADAADATGSDAMQGRPPDFGAVWREHPMYRSGARLRARVLDAGGVAVAFQGFRDRELESNCEIQMAEDGEYRCLPVTSGAIYFLDPSCTHPVYRASAATALCPETPEPYVVAEFRVFGDCGSQPWSRVFRVGEPREAAFAYVSTTSGCMPLGTLDCMREAEPLDPATFVRADLAVEQAGEGFAIERFATDDGASAIHALRDTRHGQRCSVQSEIRADTCLPLQTAQVVADILPSAREVYSDATCSAARAVIDSARDACTPPSMVVLRERTVCGTFQPKAYELGPALDTGFADDGSGCRAFAVAGQKLYQVGAELDIGSRPAVQLANGQGDRLLLRYYATSTGIPVQYDVPSFYDGLLLARCLPTPAVDGTTRCAPDGAVEIQPTGPFEDAECKQPLVAVQNPNRSSECGFVPELAKRVADGKLVRVQTLARVTGAVDQVYFQDKGERTGRGVRPGATYYRVADGVELAELQERVE
jgi:hypothetical protein